MNYVVLVIFAFAAWWTPTATPSTHSEQSFKFAGGYDVTRIFTKAELEAMLGGALKDAKIDSADLSIVRYFSVNGIAFLEAIILSARTYDPIDYEYMQKNARQTNYYKHDVPGLGEKAFWQETNAYGMLIAVKGPVLVQITISQSKSGTTREATAQKLASRMLETLAK